MARSSYIYVVREGTLPAAAFTVRHELGRWLLRQDEPTLECLDIWRLRDGQGDQEPVEISASELLDEARQEVLR